MRRITSKEESSKQPRLFMSSKDCIGGVSQALPFRTISPICSVWSISSDTHHGLSTSVGTNTSISQSNNQIKMCMKC